jgi:SAM-dependent methyltransferase
MRNIAAAFEPMNDFPRQYELCNGIYLPSRQSAGDEFGYSDGREFEERIANIISSARDKSLFSDEIRKAIWDWRSACHLSPVRANVLRPIEALCKRRVLELGCGCGILTRYLGELGGAVTALEASRFRAAITRSRTADLDNVQVVCDRIEDFCPRNGFDVVTMIGVLQYARLFSRFGKNAEIELIGIAAGNLNQNGVLVIAIQNKLALKFLAGLPEANLDAPYFGLEGRYTESSVIRFGLDELKNLLATCGLRHQAVLLPFPDYHMPVTVLNESAARPDCPFDPVPLLAASAGRDRARPDWSCPQFSLERAWESVHAAGATHYLANAFLVVAGRTDESLRFHRETKEYCWHYSIDRHPGFAIEKRFLGAKDEILVIASRLQTTPAPDVPLSHTVVNEAYVTGRLWWQSLVDILNSPGWTVADVAEWIKPWLAVLHRDDESEPYDLDEILPGALFDFTPMNCVRRPDGSLTFIDREWEVHSPLPLSYLVLRGLFGSLTSVSSCAEPAPGTPTVVIDLIMAALQAIGLVLTEAHLDHFISKEAAVQAWVMNAEDEQSTTLRRFLYGAYLERRVSSHTADKELTRLRWELTRTVEELRAAQRDLDQIRTSASWKMTAPLRTLKSLRDRLFGSKR